MKIPPPKNLNSGRQPNIPQSPQRNRPSGIQRAPKTYAEQERCVKYMDLWLDYIPVSAIAPAVGISRRTAFNWHSNLLKYGSIRKPSQLPIGRLHKLSLSDERALLDELHSTSWMYQDEMIQWLVLERGVTVSQATISTTLKRNKWTSKSLSMILSCRDESL
jgi:transposase